MPPASVLPAVVPSLRRALAVAALLGAALYLVPGWIGLAGLPWPVRAAWPAVALAAARWPSPSWLAFVVGAPLLPIVPELREWPQVSLLSMWLFALLVPAWARLAWTGERGRPGGWITLYLVLVSASLAATMASFAAGEDGASQLAWKLHEFARTDLPQLAGQRHVYASVLAWLVLAEGAGIGWLAWRALRGRGPSALEALASALVAGATLVAAWGVRQWWTRDHLLLFWREFDPFIVRVNASFTDVNALGSFFSGAFVVAVSLAVVRRGHLRVVASAAAALIALATVFTGSRVAWVALPAGTGLYLWLAHRLGGWPSLRAPAFAHRPRRVAGASVLAGVALIGALSAYATAIDARHVTQQSYLDTALYTLNLRVSPADKLKGRLPLWGAAWRMIEAHPVAGIGIGRYFKDVTLFTPDDDRLIRPQENAHNYFLQLAAECGLPTLVAWLGLVAAAVRASWVASREAPLEVRHLVCGGVAGLAAFLLTCVTGHPLLLREGQFVFWVLLAIAGAGAAIGPDPRQPRRTWPLAAASLVVLLWLPWRMSAGIASVDLSRQPIGLHAVEVAGDGTSFRWTRDRAVFYVPAARHHVELSIRTVAPIAQDVEVSLDGETVDRLRLTDSAWRRLAYVMPRAGRGARFRELAIEVRPTWRPPGDARQLGVMVRGLEWR